MQIGKLGKMFLVGILLESILSLILLVPSHNAKANPLQATTTISILATQPWTDTGIDLTQGSLVSIAASGTIFIAGSDPGKTPDGDQTCTAASDYVAPGLHCWSLIGNIASGTPFGVGSSTTFSATVGGRLYLGVNDNVFGDNSGSWTGIITVEVPTATPTIDLQTLTIQSLQPPLANTTPTFRASIRNNGSIASGFFNIQWIVDGQNIYGGHYSILAGAVDTHDYIWNNISPGPHTITFIANFDHGITESDYSNNQFTLTFTVAPPTSRQKLFILIQGINSTLSPAQAKNLTIPIQDSFGQQGGIYSFLKSKYPSAAFKMFSYNGANNLGNPTSYTCQDTFTQHLNVYVGRLKTQIIDYLNKNQDTDVYLIGHSMGGAVAFGLLADMKINGFLNVNGGKIAGVISLDSPLGGTDPLYGVNAYFTQDHFKKACPALVPKNKPPLPMLSLDDLFSTFGNGTPHGGADSIMLAINGGDFSNQELANAAEQANLPVLTIGSSLDFTYTNACPLTVSNFPSTQWVADQGDNSGIYGRIFIDKRALSKCTNAVKQIAVNHFLVLTNTQVEKGLQQFIDGKTPTAVAVAPKAP